VVFNCLRGDGRPLDLAWVEVTLVRETDERRAVIAAKNSNDLEGEIPFGIWKVHAVAPGFRHVTATYDLGEHSSLWRRRGDDSLAFTGRVHLWPDDWIPMIVRTPDGRSLETLAREAGFGFEGDLVNAFRIRTSYYEMMGGLGAPGMEFGPLCRLHPPQRLNRVELPGGVVGALEILQPRPFWVTVSLLGGTLDRQLLEASAQELVLDIDSEYFRRLDAEVSLQVVERGTRAPVSGASAELRARLSTSTSSELRLPASDASGWLMFESVMPGAYELRVTRGDELALRTFEVSPYERLDLGEVVIGAPPGVMVHVVDEEGAPVESVIDAAAYDPGRPVDELYEYDRDLKSDESGTYFLEPANVETIVRARPKRVPGSERDYDTVGTRNALIDPDDSPAELVLVVRTPVELTLDVGKASIPWEEGQHIDVEAYLSGRRRRVVIRRIVDPADPVRMLPGNYTIRRWDGGQEILFQGANVGIGPGPRTISLR